MSREFLEFEKDLANIHKDIRKLKEIKNADDQTIEQLNQLQKQYREKQSKIYQSLSPWETLQVARHPNRPHGIDFVHHLFHDIDELHGDRQSKDCGAVVCGIARLEHQPIVFIAQEKGRELKDKINRNWGMMSPEGFRKTNRMLDLAEKFQLPVISIIDTPGAYPGIEAESSNQSAAIALNLSKMSSLKTPIIVMITGEGCSGGALGVGIGDYIMMLQYATFSVISPEGCASILWRDAKKGPIASEKMCITADALLQRKIIDEVIEEPIGGAHENWQQTFDTCQLKMKEQLTHLSKIKMDKLLENRYKKIMLD